jgi:hypothetical protein
MSPETGNLRIVAHCVIFQSTTPIEPSSVGSAKLVEAIVAIVQKNDFID